MWSILVGAVVMFVFGAVWFTFLFGKMWAKLMDFNPAGDEKAKEMGMAGPMVLNFVTNLISASVVYYLFPQLLSLSFFDFLWGVLIVWFGFSFTIYANAAIWERKSWKLVMLNSAHGIISFGLLSSVIYYMN